MEIYYCRKAVEKISRDTENCEIIKKITIGQIFKNFKYNATTYTTVVVTEMDHEKGRVELHMTKRGSRTRWNLTIDSARLSKYLDDVVVPPQKPFINTQINDCGI
jgi:hypothetical protein